MSQLWHFLRGIKDKIDTSNAFKERHETFKESFDEAERLHLHDIEIPECSHAYKLESVEKVYLPLNDMPELWAIKMCIKCGKVVKELIEEQK